MITVLYYEVSDLLKGKRVLIYKVHKVCRSSFGKTDHKEKPWKHYYDINSELAFTITGYCNVNKL